MATLRRILLPLLCLCAAMPAIAGGPIIVGGPKFGDEGQPFTWAAMPINYRVDSGPLGAASARLGLYRRSLELRLFAFRPSETLSVRHGS